MKYKKQLIIIVVSYIILIVALHFIPIDALLIGNGVETIVEFNKDTGTDTIYQNNDNSDLVTPQ